MRRGRCVACREGRSWLGFGGWKLHRGRPRPLPRIGGKERQLPSRVVSAKVSLRKRFIEIWQARELVVFLISQRAEGPLQEQRPRVPVVVPQSGVDPVRLLRGVQVLPGQPHLVVRDLPLRRPAALEPVQQLAAQLGGRARRPGGDREEGLVPPRDPRPRQVGTAICYFFFQACIMLAFLIGFRVMPDWKYLPVMLFALVCDIVFSAALAVFLSAVTVYLRDVQHLIEVALVALFFSAPIVYMFTTVGHKLAAARHLVDLLLEPLVSIVLAFQRFIYGTVAPATIPYPSRPMASTGTCRARDHLGHLRGALHARDAGLRQGRGQLRRGALRPLQTAIDVQHVSKRFRLYKEKYTSLKERILHAGHVPFQDFWALVTWNSTSRPARHSGSSAGTARASRPFSSASRASCSPPPARSSSAGRWRPCSSSGRVPARAVGQGQHLPERLAARPLAPRDRAPFRRRSSPSPSSRTSSTTRSASTPRACTSASASRWP